MRKQLTRIISVLAVIALTLALGLAIFAPSAMAELTAKANHDDIKINYNYHGSTVSVSGVVDPGVDLIIKLASENGHEKLMRKDREAGIVWMNVEELKFDDVPGVYFLHSTKDPNDLLSARQLAANGLGYQGLKENARITPEPSADLKTTLFDEFIKYKESGGIYGQSVGGIDFAPTDNGGQSYYTLFQWPYQAPPGDYIATVYEIRDGQIVDTSTSAVKVEEEGTVKTLTDMAQNNGALYGTAAVGIALTAGFGVGLVFKGGGSH